MNSACLGQVLPFTAAFKGAEPSAGGGQALDFATGSEAYVSAARVPTAATSPSVLDEAPTFGLSSGCGGLEASCTLSTTTPHQHAGVSEASPFEGVPDFCSEFDFWSWAGALPRLILSTRTSFAKFLRVSFCIRERGPRASDTALFPLPVPDSKVFDPGSLPHRAAGVEPTQQSKDILVARVLHVAVMALNFIHSDCRHVPASSLQREASDGQERIFSRLRGLIWACSDHGTHSLSAGRRGTHLIARLRELSQHLTSLGLSTFPYPRGDSVSGFVPHAEGGPEILNPYRDVDPQRLKISGDGNWPLEKYLGPELKLAYLEPGVMREIPGNQLPFPAAEKEDPLRTQELLRLWDSRGLLYLSFREKQPRELSRVFAAVKNSDSDRQIGDRRGGNSLEGKLLGPSRTLPPGHMLIGITIPKGRCAVGASTDRADFYHQAKVTASKAEGNSVGPRLKTRDLWDTAVLESARGLVLASRARGEPSSTLDQALAASRLVSPGLPPSLLFDPETPVYGAFRSLYQGDHAGVEFATQAHAELLMDFGLLSERERLLAKHPASLRGPWQALVIDDFFAISAELPTTPLLHAASTQRVLLAKSAYSRDNLAGSAHKDVLGSRLFLAAGAQIDSTEKALQAGKVLVSAPTGKLLALATLSLRAASLPSITEELASNLAGSWIAALMFRRCLFATLDSFFALGKSEASSASGSCLRFLPRKEAQELVLLASLAPLMSSDVSAAFLPEVFCSDASMLRGAFCSSRQPEAVSAALWVCADKTGSYTMLDPNDPSKQDDEEEGEPWPMSLGPERPLAFDFDVVPIFCGASMVSRCCASLGLRVSPIIDLRFSVEYDLTSPVVQDWLNYLMWNRRARSIVIAFPSGSPDRGSNLKQRRKDTRSKLVVAAASLFKRAARARVPVMAFFKKGSRSFSQVISQGLLSVKGVCLLPPAPVSSPGNSSVSEDSSACPGLIFSPVEPPKTFWSSRSSTELAALEVARLLKQLVTVDVVEKAAHSPGLENIAVNDVLAAGPWEVRGAWRWEKSRHINALETEAVVSLLRELVRSGGDSRPVCIVDSSCAKGALAKGRSSAKLLRPALRRAGALCVAGGLFPAYLFGPTRLNVSDDPSRAAPLREPAENSLLQDLSESGLELAARLGGLSKWRANWIRLSSLVLGSSTRGSFLQALQDYPWRAFGPEPPAFLYPLRGFGLHPAESFALKALDEALLLPSVLGELLSLLPGAGKVRFSQEGMCEKYWTSGLFSQGPFRGLRSASLHFPASTRLACKVVSRISPGFPFSTVALLQQVRSSLHKDRNNLKGVPSLVFPLSKFGSGQIFVEGCEGGVEQNIEGQWLRGEALPVLDGHRRHATLEWHGFRQVAVACCVKDPWKVPLRARRQASRLGFNLPTAKSASEWISRGSRHLKFDPSLGFPGEGPAFRLTFLLFLAFAWTCFAALLGPRNEADRLRALRRSPAGLPTGRVVLPRTGSYRADLAVAFSQWLEEVTGSTLQSLLDKKPFDPELVADALVMYGRDLYGSGRPYWHYAETINSVTSVKPVLRRQVQAAWDLGFAWLAEEPYSHHTAIPPAVLLAVLTASLLWGWTREAGCFAMAFGGVMRIGEVFKATRASLILPQDVGFSQSFVLVKIEEPKTRHRGPRHQAAKIEAVDLVSVVTVAFSKLSAGEKLWPFSPQTLRKRFDILLKKVGASPPLGRFGPLTSGLSEQEVQHTCCS